MNTMTTHERNILHEARTKIKLELQYLEAQLEFEITEYCVEVVQIIIDHIDKVKDLAEAVVYGDDSKAKYIEKANDARESAVELSRKKDTWKENDIAGVLGEYSQTAFNILWSPAGAFIKSAMYEPFDHGYEQNTVKDKAEAEAGVEPKGEIQAKLEAENKPENEVKIDVKTANKLEDEVKVKTKGSLDSGSEIGFEIKTESEFEFEGEFGSEFESETGSDIEGEGEVFEGENGVKCQCKLEYKVKGEGVRKGKEEISC